MKRTCGSGRWARGGLALCASWIIGTACAQGALTPDQRAWLRAHEPIVFVSQSAYPPFEFVNENGHQAGMCLDLVQWMAQTLDFQVTFRHMSFQEAQEAVLNGGAHVLTSLFHSAERDQRFDFSAMTWEVPALMFVAAERPDILGLSDLRGKRIAMQRGDYAEEFLRARGIDYEVAPTTTFGEAVDRVCAGQADALIGDRPIVLYHLFQRGLTARMKSVGEPLYIGRNSMAVREGEQMLREILNTGLAQARASGAFDQITARWLGRQYTPPPADWTSGYALPLAIALLVAVSLVLILLAWSLHQARIVARQAAEYREAHDPLQPVTPTHIWRRFVRQSLLLLCILLILGLATRYLLHEYVVRPGFTALEQQDAGGRMAGALEALRNEARHLQRLAQEWVRRTEIYPLRPPDPPATHFVVPDMSALSNSNQVDVILLLDARGDIRGHGLHDPFAQQILSPDDLSAPGSTGIPRLPPEPFPSAALIGTRIGPLLLVACPVPASVREHTDVTTLLIGRFVRPDTLRAISHQVGARLRIVDPLHADCSAEEQAMLAALAPGGQAVRPTSRALLTGYVRLAEPPGLLLALDMPRQISAQGRLVLRLISFLLFESILIFFAGATIWFFLSYRETFRRQAHVEALVNARTQALAQTEQKYRFQAQILDSVSDAVVATDLDCRILYWGRGAEALYGYRAEEVLNKPYHQFAGSIDAQDQAAFKRELLEQGGWHGEHRQRRRDGTTFWAAVNIFVFKDAAGKPCGFIGIDHDITAHKEAALEKERLEAQLRQAHKMESVGRLAGGVAHDFNNMLGVILGNAEMALHQLDPASPVIEDLTEIRKAAERSADLTRRLLAFARKQTIAPRRLDVNDTVSNMLSMLRRLLGEQIELAWEPAADLAPVKMDPSQLDQVLVNLCVNARDAIAQMGAITLRTENVAWGPAECAGHPEAAPGQYVCLIVRDDGCGMNEDVLAHLFEPFFTTKSVGQGTGLGLSMVYGIVKQNQGFIEVDSHPAQGTTFRIYLPSAAEAVRA
ncbi:MAG: transporter substrate-binding domain-containing protein [Candidatus Marinimicrobia bacterium]|nr:transporter substrate-binding domain-containing protein [Candidatus Neomarinimicrobiota bacterium]